MNKLLITIVLAMCLVAYASIDDPYSDGDTSVDTRPINVKHHWVHDSKLSNHHELHRHIHRRIDDPYSGDSVDDPYSGDGDTSVDVSNKPSINPDDVEYHWVHDNKYSNRRKSIRNRRKNRGAIFKCFKESSECGGKYELMKVRIAVAVTNYYLCRLKTFSNVV